MRARREDAFGLTDPDTRGLLERASSGMVIDALRRIGISGGLPGVLAQRGFRDRRVVGAAATVQYGPLTERTQPLSMYDVIRRTPPDTILVVDGHGLERHFFGDNMAHIAKRQGIVGVIVFGGTRDTHGFRTIDLPVYSMGPAIEPFPPNFGVVSHQTPLQLGSARAHSNDLVLADEDGVAIVPAHAVERFAASLRVVMEVEDKLRAVIAADGPVDAILQLLNRKKGPDH